MQAQNGVCNAARALLADIRHPACSVSCSRHAHHCPSVSGIATRCLLQDMYQDVENVSHQPSTALPALPKTARCCYLLALGLHCSLTYEPSMLLAAQDVKALEKKWRRKVKEARAEKESLRSELAGRLALLADRMTQLASKEARHETRQGEPSICQAGTCVSGFEYCHIELLRFLGQAFTFPARSSLIAGN